MPNLRDMAEYGIRTLKNRALASAVRTAHVRFVPTEEQTMHEILKLLNDRSASDLAELDDNELERFEALCENWRTHAEAERGLRKSRPRPTTGSE